MSSTWNHLSRRWKESESALADSATDSPRVGSRFYSPKVGSPGELMIQLTNMETAESAAGHLWRDMLARGVCGCGAAVLQICGRGRGATDFWGDSQECHRGPTVLSWIALDDQGRQLCIEVMQKRTDWVVGARTSPPDRGQRKHREFESHGRVLAGQKPKGRRGWEQVKRCRKRKAGVFYYS